MPLQHTRCGFFPASDGGINATLPGGGGTLGALGWKTEFPTIASVWEGRSVALVSNLDELAMSTYVSPSAIQVARRIYDSFRSTVDSQLT